MFQKIFKGRSKTKLRRMIAFLLVTTFLLAQIEHGKIIAMAEEVDKFVDSSEIEAYMDNQEAIENESQNTDVLDRDEKNVSDEALTGIQPQAALEVVPYGANLHYKIVNAWASGDDGNGIDNAIDGITSTRWSVNGEGQWAVFELSEAKEIAYVGIAFYTTTARGSKFDIEVSEDGVAWTKVITNQTSEVSTTALLQPFSFPEKTSVIAKYIKYIGYGNTTNLWNSVIDLQVYPPSQNGYPVDLLEQSQSQYDPNIIYKKPGFYSPDGLTAYAPHTPNATTGNRVNVMDFYAVPDDGNDDKTAIQNAINTAHYGDEIYFPNGIYNLIADANTSTMLTLKSGVNLRGESKEGVLILAKFDKTDNRTSVMRVLGKNNIVISNMTIKGDVADPSYTIDHNVNQPKGNEPTYLIHIEDVGEGVPSYNIDIEDVVLEKCKEMAIRISRSHDVSVRRITVRNLTDVGGGGAGYGVSIQGAGNKINRLGYENDTYYNLVEDSFFEGPYIRHGTLIQYYAHNNLVQNNTYDKTVLDSIDLHGEDEYLNEIRNNDVKNVMTGGAIGVGNTGATHRNAGSYNYIHNNTITNCRDGIRVYLETPDTIIEENMILNTTQPDAAVGIWIQNAPRTIIRGNMIQNNTAKDFWGIKLEYDNGDPINGGAGMPEDIKIENNTITDNTNGVWIKDGYFITLLDNFIKNNLGVDLINNAVEISEVSNLVVTEGDKNLSLKWNNPTKKFF